MAKVVALRLHDNVILLSENSHDLDIVPERITIKKEGITHRIIIEGHKVTTGGT